MNNLKSKSKAKGIRILKIQDEKYFIILPNLNIPVEINKYLYEQWSKLNEFKQFATSSAN